MVGSARPLAASYRPCDAFTWSRAWRISMLSAIATCTTVGRSIASISWCMGLTTDESSVSVSGEVRRSVGATSGYCGATVIGSVVAQPDRTSAASA